MNGLIRVERDILRCAKTSAGRDPDISMWTEASAGGTGAACC